MTWTRSEQQRVANTDSHSFWVQQVIPGRVHGRTRPASTIHRYRHQIECRWWTLSSSWCCMHELQETVARRDGQNRAARTWRSVTKVRCVTANQSFIAFLCFSLKFVHRFVHYKGALNTPNLMTKRTNFTIKHPPNCPQMPCGWRP